MYTDVVQRLAIFRSHSTKFLGATRFQSVQPNEKPCFQVSLNESDLYGLIKGLQNRQVRYRFDAPYLNYRCFNVSCLQTIPIHYDKRVFIYKPFLIEMTQVG